MILTTCRIFAKHRANSGHGHHSSEQLISEHCRNWR